MENGESLTRRAAWIFPFHHVNPKNQPIFSRTQNSTSKISPATRYSQPATLPSLLQCVERGILKPTLATQDMSVDHRRGDIIMPQQLLHGADIRSPLKHVQWRKNVLACGP